MYPEAGRVPGVPNEPEDDLGGAALQEVSAAQVQREFYDVRVLASGWYTQVFSARHQRLPDGRRLVLKAVRRGATTRHDFMREARHHAFLSACPHVLACFPPAFATTSSFVLPLEEAPAGDLAGLVGRGGVGEAATQRVAAQVGAATAFTHAAGLVHRDLTPANVLAMDDHLWRLRLADFGATRRAGAMVERSTLPLPWLAPEVACLHPHQLYAAHPAQDAWQLGLLLVACLTGALPWAAADPEDPHYAAWIAWARDISQTPAALQTLLPRFLRLLRRLLHPDPARRCSAAAVQQEAEAGRRWLARDPDPFDPCLQEAPRPAALLKRAERKVSTALRRYLRRASPRAIVRRYKKVTFAEVLEERREVEPLHDTDDEEDLHRHHLEEEEEEEEEEEDAWCWGGSCLLDQYWSTP